MISCLLFANIFSKPHIHDSKISKQSVCPIALWVCEEVQDPFFLSCPLSRNILEIYTKKSITKKWVLHFLTFQLNLWKMILHFTYFNVILWVDTTCGF